MVVDKLLDWGFFFRISMEMKKIKIFEDGHNNMGLIHDFFFMECWPTITNYKQWFLIREEINNF